MEIVNEDLKVIDDGEQERSDVWGRETPASKGDPRQRSNLDGAPRDEIENDETNEGQSF